MNEYMLTAVIAAIIVTPIVALGVLARCGRKSFFCSLAMTIVVAAMAWFARGIKESFWRSDQGLHIRWNVTNFSDQYDRLRKLGDEALLHTYVTNFTCNACTLLNYTFKYAPNTSNLVERYYYDWDERINKAKSERTAGSGALTTRF